MLALTTIKPDEDPIEKQHDGDILIILTLFHWVDFAIVYVKLNVFI